MRLESVLPLMALGGALIGFLFGLFAALNVALSTITGFFIGLSPLLLLVVVGMALESWSPDRPECVCGQCKSDGYSYYDMDRDEEGKPSAFRYHCPKCGRSYMSRDKQFLEIKNGHAIPYQKRNKWGRWSAY